MTSCVRRLVLQVVEPGEGGNHVAKRRVLGDIGDPLAVQPDFAPVAQALDVACPVHGAGRADTLGSASGGRLNAW